MDKWAPLAEGQVSKVYAPGQFIYLQSTQPTEFYYLEKGTARSFISSPEGTERLLTLHRTGDLMGEASFFDQCPRVSSAVAVTECKVISIDNARIERVLREHPELTLPLLRYLARTVRLLSGHVDEITFRPADHRLVRILLERIDSEGNVRATHDELGSAIGASRVTVSRVLGQLAANGWIERGYGTLHVLNRSALEKYIQVDI